jgi:hypothetical protein
MLLKLTWTSVIVEENGMCCGALKQYFNRRYNSLKDWKIDQCDVIKCQTCFLVIVLTLRCGGRKNMLPFSKSTRTVSKITVELQRGKCRD